MSAATAYAIHPLAHLLPEMREAEFAELRDDIAANGLHEPITLYEEQILDGRHRYRACEELGTGAHYVIYDGDAPAAYVLSLNVKRRQLTQSQKAMLATDFLPHLAAERRESQRLGLRRGGDLAPLESPDHNGAPLGRASAAAAEQVGVGHAQVVRANKIKNEDPELAERVRNGDVTVGAAITTLTEREVLAARTAALRGERKSPTFNLETERGKQVAAKQARRFTELTTTLGGYAEGLPSFDIALIRAAMEPMELDEWISSLGKSLTAFRRFRTDLQEGRN